MTTPRGYFISIEGIEGMGKSTAIKYITQLLTTANITYTITREPGGTPIAEAIRQVLLQHYPEPMNENTELLLMFACRAQNVAQIIKPALEKKTWVISDRFVDASFAYQGGGRGIAKSKIQSLAEWVLGDLKPDLTLLLDAPVETGLKRIHRRGKKDRIENEGSPFMQKVRDAYLQCAQEEPQRFVIINAAQNIQQVNQDIHAALQPFIERSQT